MKDKPILLSDVIIIVGILTIYNSVLIISLDVLDWMGILIGIGEIIFGYYLSKEGVEKDEHNNSRMSE